MLAARAVKEVTDHTRVIVDFTPWLDSGEFITTVVSQSIQLGSTGWSTVPFPPANTLPPYDPSPLTFISVDITQAGTELEVFFGDGSPGNVYTAQFVVLGTSGRQVTLEVGVQVLGVPQPGPPFIAPIPEGALPLSGGQMLGPLYLFEDPVVGTEAATRHYVDVSVAALSSSIGAIGAVADAAVKRAGDTMTGLLVLSGNPTATLGAATKGYVDTKAAGYLPLTGGSMSGALIMNNSGIRYPGIGTVGNHEFAFSWDGTDVHAWVDGFDLGALIRSASGYLPLSGGTMTGLLTTQQLNVSTSLHIDPAGSFGWQFYREVSGRHIMQHQAGWYDYWRATDGLRGWANPGGDMMVLDANSHLTLTGPITTNAGRMRSINAGGSPSVLCYDTSLLAAAGMWFEPSSALGFGAMDGNGNPITRWFHATSSNLTADHDFFVTGVAAFANQVDFQIARTGSVRSMQFAANYAWLYDEATHTINWLSGPTGTAITFDPPSLTLFNNVGPVAGNGAYINTSDADAKTNIAPITLGMDVVAAIMPVSFHRVNADGSTNPVEELGFTAQDVRAAVPQAVCETRIMIPGTQTPALGLQSEMLLAVAWNALRQLDERVAQLELSRPS